MRSVTHVVINKGRGGGRVGHRLREGGEGLKDGRRKVHTLFSWSAETICLQDRSRSWPAMLVMVCDCQVRVLFRPVHTAKEKGKPGGRTETDGQGKGDNNRRLVSRVL